MITASVTIKNGVGLHARPASDFVKSALRYKSKITITSQLGKLYNAKSIVSVLSAGIRQFDTISLAAEGDDEQEAISSLVTLIEKL
jgi:phosphocarrier protein HPr